jgi:hypothetical protein
MCLLNRGLPLSLIGVQQSVLCSADREVAVKRRMLVGVQASVVFGLATTISVRTENRNIVMNHRSTIALANAAWLVHAVLMGWHTQVYIGQNIPK